MKQGFTLTELLIVVFIAGMLAAIALPQYSKSVERSRTVEVLSTARTIVDAMNRAFLTNPNVWPTTKQFLDVQVGGGQWIDDSTFQTKDFVYDIGGGKSLEIDRISGGEKLYHLTIYNRFSEDKHGKSICKSETDMGSYICKTLQDSGFEAR